MRKRSLNLTIASVMLSVAAAFAPFALAAAGDYDPTFGNAGTATDWSANNVTVHKILVQPDGRIIVVGTRKVPILTGPPIDKVFVRRYTSTGVLDTSYTGLKPGIGYDAELQPDGKLVVIGAAPNTVYSREGLVMSTISPVVWRFNSNGSIDTSFGTSGAAFFNTTERGNFHIEVFAGSIFIAYGSRPMNVVTTSYKVSRLDSNGSTDFSLTMPMTYVSGEKAFSMKVDAASGDMIVAGPKSTNQNTVLRRYTQNGALVTSFGTSGEAAVPDCSTPNPELRVKDLVIQPDGSILVHRYTGSGNRAVNISRQSSGGTADGLLRVSLSSSVYRPRSFSAARRKVLLLSRTQCFVQSDVSRRHAGPVYLLRHQCAWRHSARPKAGQCIGEQ